MKPPSAAALAELVQSRTPAYSSSISLRRARQMHAVVLTTTDHSSPPFLNNNLISMYARSCSLDDAVKVFDTMPSRNLVSYNAVISACARTSQRAGIAFRLLPEMALLGFRSNGLTLASLLVASCSLRDRLAGTMVHSQVVRSGFLNDAWVQTALLGLYSRCSDSNASNRVFDDMCDRDAVAWNAIIHSNVKNGNARQATRLFSSMLRAGIVPTEFTFSAALSACRQCSNGSTGEALHAQIIKLEFLVDVALQNALLDMYASCGDLAAALAVFKEIDVPVLVSWNSMISSYSDNGDAESAMSLFIQLMSVSSDGIQPDDYTYAAIVSATASLPAALYGKPLHAQVEKSGLLCSIFVTSTLIDMYFNNQEPNAASKLFGLIADKDAIIWTAMIVGHSRVGEGETAIWQFYNMMAEGHKVDSFSLSSALNSCADLGALKQGEMIHSLVMRTGYQSDVCVCGSLIDMYAKNGCLLSARLVFDFVENPDLKCWNAMLGGYGTHGYDQLAFKLFSEIMEHGLQPDHVTFLSLLSACSHCGLVERGKLYWEYMIERGLVPGAKHYSCMINLVSRAGLLQEAEDLIMGSQFAAGFPEIWRILLNSCVTFKELKLGINAAERILVMEPDDSSTYIMLSNLYASVGRWEDVSEIRRRIRGLLLDKDPGLSWIEVKDEVHIFSADDELHTRVEDARAELQRLQGNLKSWESSEFEYLMPVVYMKCS